MTTERMAVLREELAQATRAEDRLHVLDEMVGLAAELVQDGGDAATSAAAGLDEALAGLRDLRELWACAESAVDEDHYVTMLYLIGQAGLLRDGDSDLDDAIACLRELRDVMLAEPAGPADGLEEAPGPDAEDTPDFAEIMAEVEFGLGQALFNRVSRSGGVTDLDAASAAFVAALDWMASDAPARLPLISALAILYANRYGVYGGTQDHRMAALALAAEGLASPDPAQDEMANSHVVVAWMTLTRQMTSEQRSTALRAPEMEAARRGEPGAANMLAELGDMHVELSDAETALSHLRQVPETASLDEDLVTMAPILSTWAMAVAMDAGQVEADVDQVTRQMQNLARQESRAPVEQGELLAMSASLLAARALSEGHSDELKPSSEALQEAAVHLPGGHPFREPLLDQLRQSLSQQVEQAELTQDAAAGAERIMDTLETMPRDDPQFARLLTLVMLRVLNMLSAHRNVVPLERLGTQLEQTVSRLEPDDPLRPLGESMRWSAIAAAASQEHRPDLMDPAIDGLIRCARDTPEDNPFRPFTFLGVASALAERYVMKGEIRHVEEAEKYIALACAASGPTGVLAEPNSGYPTLVRVRGALLVARSQYDHVEAQDLEEMIAAQERALTLLKPGDPLRPRLVAGLETVRTMREVRDSPGGPGVPMARSQQEAFERILTEARNINRDHPDFPALAAQAAAGLMLRALSDSDVASIGQAISLLTEACAVPGLTYRERPRMLNVLGSALLARYRMSRDPRDLSHAIDRLEEARRAVEQELGSPYAADVLQVLASAYRIRGDAARGDVDRAVTVGLDALREHAGDVLLQDDDHNALRAARQLTSDANEMARWFLWHSRGAAVIEALEFGRGTVLHAATSGARLAEALEDAGQAGLAAEWALDMSGGAASPDAADDLRYRIMMAIEGSSAQARVLAPPSLDEVTACLAASKVDALVYLLPRSEEGSGLAVLVDPGGSVRPLVLPGLQAGPGTPVGSFLQARREAGGNWQAALGELCDWTWRVAMGPVLEAIPARGHGSRRIVLVPGGELGLVAWHAARQAMPGGYRYAMQEAVFSYASSARQFVDAARRQPRPWAQAPVLISDAEASLYTTAIGIGHLHAAYYPAASVFGYARTVSSEPLDAAGSDAATQNDVLTALPHGASPGASLLHFGCHGKAQVPVLASHLDLGEDNTVAVGDILRQARKRAGTVSGGLVVLASCLTDVAEADYDEAITLATAFLSAGAAGVVAARWKIPDRDTALFMAAFHHYLNGSDRHPADALRSAQMWMLDPSREPLRPLPRLLHDETSKADLADPVAWAGFTYQGW